MDRNIQDICIYYRYKSVEPVIPRGNKVLSIIFNEFFLEINYFDINNGAFKTINVDYEELKRKSLVID